jgi:hypothetical protein
LDELIREKNPKKNAKNTGPDISCNLAIVQSFEILHTSFIVESKNAKKTI